MLVIYIETECEMLAGEYVEVLPLEKNIGLLNERKMLII